MHTAKALRVPLSPRHQLAIWLPGPVCCSHLPGLQLEAQRLLTLLPRSPHSGAEDPKARSSASPAPQPPPRRAGHRPGAVRTARPTRLLPSPAGRLKKRLRAARRCWRVSGLQSLLWPFRHRFSLAAVPERSRPLRAMLEPAPRAAAPRLLPFRFRRSPPS